MDAITLNWNGQEFLALREKALHWPSENTLFVADCHFGKSAFFRQSGIPVPEGSTRDDLLRLSSLIESTRVSRLVFLGDFFHAERGKSESVMRLISDWQARHASIERILVLGNHDRRSGRIPADWKMEVVDTLDLEGLSCVHDPRTPSPGKKLGGHVHPVVHLKELNGKRLRLPCFLFHPEYILLPSFGSFTGGAQVKPTASDRVIVVTPDGLVNLRAGGT